jgi:hypothetical protein
MAPHAALRGGQEVLSLSSVPFSILQNVRHPIAIGQSRKSLSEKPVHKFPSRDSRNRLCYK